MEQLDKPKIVLFYSVSQTKFPCLPRKVTKVLSRAITRLEISSNWGRAEWRTRCCTVGIK